MNPNVFPKSGYMFQERDGTRIFGQTWAGVVARVARYRQRANLPPGDPQGEVVAQACQREPSLCQDDNGQNQAFLQRASLKTLVLQWLSQLRGRAERNEIEFVEDAVSRSRADICAKCRHNQPLPDGCASCRAVLVEMRRTVLGKRYIDGRLHECAALGEDTPVSTHLEAQALDRPDLPENCWRRRSL
jgi:hypothetical protein